MLYIVLQVHPLFYKAVYGPTKLYMVMYICAWLYKVELGCTTRLYLVVKGCTWLQKVVHGGCKRLYMVAKRCTWLQKVIKGLQG